MVQKAVYGIKKMAKKLLKAGGQVSEDKKNQYLKKMTKTKNLAKFIIYQCKLVIIIMKLNICQLQKVLIQLIFEISQANFDESLRCLTF